MKKGHEVIVLEGIWQHEVDMCIPTARHELSTWLYGDFSDRNTLVKPGYEKILGIP